ncbi:MAG TPA: 2-amino-4-hydroxy-6-hydroxymethyldihydropteridine diphosphokinase [Chroococcidiopsis sp.]
MSQPTNQRNAPSAAPAPSSGVSYGASSGDRVAIALGSNLGDSCAILDAALKALAYTADITLNAQSSYYQTVAVGPPQPDYLNASALLSTSLSPQTLLNTLFDIEKQFGRVRRERWGPRLLDIDLLLFDDQVIATDGLQVPHPRMAERAFVLVPLAEIAPDWIDPLSGQAIATLLTAVDCSGVTRYSRSLTGAAPCPDGS